MSALKIAWVSEYEFFESKQAWVNRPHDVSMVPVVRLDELRAWLEAHQYPLQYGEVNANSVINDLLAELKDLA